jgi:DNA-binding winged helix-turn-helix (wHTH) protein/TolB-like protein
MPNVAPAETIRFGAFELDLRAGELRKDGARIKLHNQPFQVLTLLIEHPGQIVTREELRQKLWGSDTFVDFDVGLNSAIKKLRDALGDAADAPRFIETVPRRGYRFIGLQIRKPAAPLRSRVPRWTVAVLVLCAVAGATLLFLMKQRRAIAATRPIRSLAILPFNITAADRSDQLLGLGLPDLLITRLSNVRHLIIRPTSAVRGFAARGVTSLEAGRTLRVDAVLEGSMAKDGLSVATQTITFQPGGQSGWHTHPGPVFISVKEGTMTFYEDDCTSTVLMAGQGFFDAHTGSHPHLARNETGSPATNVVTYFLPPGTTTLRKDAPPPLDCQF